MKGHISSLYKLKIAIENQINDKRILIESLNGNTDLSPEVIEAYAINEIDKLGILLDKLESINILLDVS